ncbi:hypothetical protein BALAC2494_02051 [Bifidobacterium animalis subsp. lactis CNCM I-2494]|uniref:Uncharacterized protein n=1 Tax=Bifidobacterium animalis subsp. lactis CNCM I-2494 TaxID=1042403 RepID=A0A806FWJ4_BIFAN|nr:hypothetical protein BALAC2494_02051 [Bifidobacterium animalis subsp. lactis CNCM I-2494]
MNAKKIIAAIASVAALALGERLRRREGRRRQCRG